MTYRLKDRELQKKLDEISGGTFSKALQNFRSTALLIEPPIKFSHVDFGNGFDGKNSYPPRLTMRFKTDEIEQVPEYDPNAWNNYPEVTPPEGVWMRCEFVKRLNGQIERYVAKYTEDGQWIDQCGYDVCNVDRFRPWGN